MQADTLRRRLWQQNCSSPVSWILIIIPHCLLTLITIFNSLHTGTGATVYHHLIKMEFVIFLHCYFYSTLCKMRKKTDWVLLWMLSTISCEKKKERGILNEYEEGKMRIASICTIWSKRVSHMDQSGINSAVNITLITRVVALRWHFLSDCCEITNELKPVCFRLHNIGLGPVGRAKGRRPKWMKYNRFTKHIPWGGITSYY